MTAHAELIERDRALLHPLHHPSAHEQPLIFESGNGVWMRNRSSSIGMPGGPTPR